MSSQKKIDAFYQANRDVLRTIMGGNLHYLVPPQSGEDDSAEAGSARFNHLFLDLAQISQSLQGAIVVELGCGLGTFAEHVLKTHPEIRHYFAVDANRENALDTFDRAVRAEISVSMLHSLADLQSPSEFQLVVYHGDALEFLEAMSPAAITPAVIFFTESIMHMDRQRVMDAALGILTDNGIISLTDTEDRSANFIFTRVASPLVYTTTFFRRELWSPLITELGHPVDTQIHDLDHLVDYTNIKVLMTLETEQEQIINQLGARTYWLIRIAWLFVHRTTRQGYYHVLVRRK